MKRRLRSDSGVIESKGMYLTVRYGMGKSRDESVKNFVIENIDHLLAFSVWIRKNQ